MPDRTRFAIAPYAFADALALERELGVSHVLAQVLMRRGLGDPAAARAFLAAEEAHPPAAFAGMDAAVELIAQHVAAGSRITVHGDYDVDGVCSTAVLVRSLRRLGARPDWFLPSRLDDGYGLSAATVERLAARGTRLLITVDCAITAVEEVAAARAAGLDVVVTDHHSSRADGRLPDAPIVHPGVCGYPCAELCATAVAAKLAEALEAGRTRSEEDGDLDLVGLATVADCVPLRGENRRLVRAGLRALAGTTKPGLRALMRVAEADPGALDARVLGFRLAPRINAAGRLHRADAGLELMLTEDPGRAAEIAAELDSANAERRDVETRIRFEAESQAAELADRPALVLAGEGWHPGVIGIVASRIADRYHRPTVMIALDGARGHGSGRSIPAFDLLAGLHACSGHLVRHGGHRAAAGLEIDQAELPSFRAAFEHHAASVLSPHDLVPEERVDAIVGGDALGLELAEELERLAPFGIGNPAVSLMLPATVLTDPVAMGEGKHLRFRVHGGGSHSRAVAFGAPRLPVPAGEPADASFRLECDNYNGAVSPRLVLRRARPCEPDPPVVRGEPENYVEGVLAEIGRAAWPPPPAPAVTAGVRTRLDRRGLGIAGTLADVTATREGVLVVCADVARRLPSLGRRLGGFSVCSWLALEREPGLARAHAHVVALDPPAHAHQDLLLAHGPGGAFAHLAWGEPELRFAHRINQHEFGLRASLAALYRTLRGRDGGAGEELEAVLRGDAEHPRSPALAGRLLGVLEELGLVRLDRERFAVEVPAGERTALERSAAFRACERRREDAERYLSRATARAA